MAYANGFLSIMCDRAMKKAMKKALRELSSLETLSCILRVFGSLGYYGTKGRSWLEVGLVFAVGTVKWFESAVRLKKPGSISSKKILVKK
jgi:hypothetical protein